MAGCRKQTRLVLLAALWNSSENLRRWGSLPSCPMICERDNTRGWLAVQMSSRRRCNHPVAGDESAVCRAVYRCEPATSTSRRAAHLRKAHGYSRISRWTQSAISCALDDRPLRRLPDDKTELTASDAQPSAVSPESGESRAFATSFPLLPTLNL